MARQALGNYPLLTIRRCFHLESDAVVNISPDCHSNIPCEVQAGSVGKKDTVVAFSTVHMRQFWYYIALSSLCISISKLRKAANFLHFLVLLLLDVCSLVPRPSHCAVFDCLQYAKMVGGRVLLSCE